MYLQKLVLDGFKSFYTRTEITFEDGIIGIVGPNGCGKSNVYDAVQWILGEQSAKQLRGDEISDVISTGNVRRAAKNHAEAHLTFADCRDVLDVDRDEVQVGRRVDRDGTGTYYLNGEEVRLRDIQDLFRDTGVGQDLYSTIGQGEVFSLIESKPEERREIIEEAAGIATFRHRRDVTRRRLDQTRDELEDVQKELNQKQGRLSQLQRQAEQAREVRRLRTRLRKHRLELARRNYERIRESIENLSENRDAAREELQEARSRVENVERRRSRVRDTKRELENRHERVDRFRRPLRDTLQDLREGISRRETRIDSLDERTEREVRSVRNARDRIRGQLEELSDSHRRRYHQDLRARILDREVRWLENREETLDEQRRTNDRALEQLRDQSLFKFSENNEIKQNLGEARRKQENTSEEIDRLGEEIGAVRSRREKRSRQYAAARRRLIEAEKSAARLRLNESIHRNREQTLADLRATREDDRREIKALLQRRQDRLEDLEREYRSYEGIRGSVQEVMQAHDEGQIGGKLEPLVNTIQVSEPHGRAIRCALGEDLDALVVDTASTAQRVLRYLDDQNLGRIRLLVREHYESLPSARPGSQQAPSDRGWARDHLDCDPFSQPVVDALLGRTLVVEGLSDLLDRAGADPSSSPWHQVVTLNGVKWDARGVISRSSPAEAKSDPLRKKQDIKRLKQIIEDLQDRHQELRERTQLLNGLDGDVKRQLDQLEGALGGVQDEVRTYRDRFRKYRHEWEKASQEYEDLVDRYVQRVHQQLILRYRAAGLSTIQERFEDRSSTHQERIDQYRRRSDELEEALRRWRDRRRNREQAREQARSARREARRQIDQGETRRAEEIQSLQESLEHVESARRERLQLASELVRNRLNHRWSRIRFNRWQELRERMEEKQTEVEEHLQSLNEELRDRERSAEEKRGRKRTLTSQLENQQERLEETVETIHEEFGMNPDELDDEVDDGELRDRDRDQLTDRIQRDQQQIEDYQPVNMLAGQEAEELEEEVELTRSQVEDLEKSCDRLEGLIDRLNRKARDQFQDAFEEIQQAFEHFIGELFQGGEGHLTLSDDPILEAGVQIEIKPPGESIKNMSALSGGEKTLGALAFLFSLYERKPTPFCFLDEVDQSFDDENINQFVDLLVRYQDRTQFLVITHNKSTMQAADKLFGVTMEESGVTSVVPMDLQEADRIREPRPVQT